MGCVVHNRSTVICYVSCILVTLSSVILATGLTQNVFKVMKGYTLSRGTQLKTVSSKWNSATFCSILCTSECGSAIYHTKNKTCITFVEKLYQSNLVLTNDSNLQVLYREEQRVKYGDWTLVFRAQKEINVSLYDVWTHVGRSDDSLLSSGVLNGCYRLDNLSGCKQHFRSSILDNWTNIKQIKFSLYENGSEVKYIVFNGTSTTRNSWFRKSKILNSSWSGMRNDAEVEHFEILGKDLGPNIRRFVICGQYGSCSSDTTYFLAVDKSEDECSQLWKINVTNYPVFVYSTKNWLARLGGQSQSDYQFADILAVFVKF